MITHILGLAVRIDGEPSSADADLDVSLLGGSPWPADLAVLPERVCYTDPETDEAGQPTLIVSQCGRDFYRLRYWDESEFLVDRPGCRVWARWPASLPLGEILVCLFGPIIGFVLHLRGTPCLHASAIFIDGRAVAFLGHSGAGKSTTAAAFVRRGFAALTDDVLALDLKPDRAVSRPSSGWRRAGRPARRAGAIPVTSALGAEDGWGCSPTGPEEPEFGVLEPPEEYLVRPGHNVVRLAPDAVRALYGAEDALPHGGDTTDKRHLELATSAPTEPVPLAAIYVLHERRPDLERPVVIDDLKGHEALMALVARTYMNYVLDAELRTRALDVFSRLAARVPVRQLTVRDNASDLGAVVDAIVADVRRV